MQSFNTTESGSRFYCNSSFLLRGEDTNRYLTTRFSDLQHSFQQHDAVDLSSSYSLPLLITLYNSSFSLNTLIHAGSVFGVKSNNVAVVPSNLQYGSFNTNLGSAEMASTIAGCVETGQHQPMFQKGTSIAIGNQHVENWADNSQQTEDTSTDIDADDKNQCFSTVSWCNGVQDGAPVAVESKDQTKSTVKAEDQKTLRRLAQNREAARKSRLRKKAYVQQLESSRVRLAELERELQQGVNTATGIMGDHGHSAVGNGAVAFDMEYARWVDEHHRFINDIRLAVTSQTGDTELQHLVDGAMAHYDELYRLKSIGAKADVFHILSGMWKTPIERCFMWIGGFRSSELLKIVRNHLDPLTDQQLMGIYNLQQSSQQAEDALSQGIEALQLSLSDTLSSTSLGPNGSGNVAEYMGQMAIAMGKLASLESFLHQADLLRQQTLKQLRRILTTLQAARALLVINDYVSRLRALNSLWLACPKEY